MSLSATPDAVESRSGTAVSTVTPPWISTDSCVASYLAGRAAGLAAIATDKLPDEIADDVVRLLRAVA